MESRPSMPPRRSSNVRFAGETPYNSQPPSPNQYPSPTTMRPTNLQPQARASRMQIGRPRAFSATPLPSAPMVDRYTELPSRPAAAMNAYDATSRRAPYPALVVSPQVDSHHPNRPRHASDATLYPDMPLPTTPVRQPMIEEGGLPAAEHFNTRPTGYRRFIDSFRYHEDDDGVEPEYLDTGSRMSRSSSVATTAVWDTQADDPDDLETGPVKSRPMMSRAGSTFDGDGKAKAPQKRVKQKHGKLTVSINTCSHNERITCIKNFARACIAFGAPSNRVESFIMSIATVLQVDCTFVMTFDSINFFFKQDDGGSRVEIVRETPGVDLSRVYSLHTIYRQVMHDVISAAEGSKKIVKLLKAKPPRGKAGKVVVAFCCGAAICGLAFGGSFVDLWAGGALSAASVWVTLSCKSPGLATGISMLLPLVISCISRAISAINNSSLFCYQAVASGGVVLNLPGFLLLTACLDVTTGNFQVASTKMVIAIMTALSLAFELTAGSDLLYLAWGNARQRQQEATAALSSVMTLAGNFTASNSTQAEFQQWNGTFTFSNSTAITAYQSQWINGCIRHSDWPWYAQPLPKWSLAITVPIFAIAISLWLGQRWRSRQFIAQIVISALGFVANMFAQTYALKATVFVSSVGAFVVAILGGLNSRFFGASAYSSSVPGVLFLVPSGLSAAGGLAETYRGTNDDYFSASLNVAARMLQVGIGVTFGLSTAYIIAYAFGNKKRTPPWSF